MNTITAPNFRNPALANERLASIADAIEHGRQIAMVIEASSHCDLACEFCAAHSPKVPDKIFGIVGPITKQKKHMSAEVFAGVLRLLKDQPPLKMMFFHGNGEPLLNPKLAEFAAQVKTAGVAKAMTVVTNGTLLNAQRFVALAEAGVDIFRVSLDFMTPEVYKAVKGVDRAARVVGNLEECIGAIRERGLAVTVSIECKEWQDDATDDEATLIVEHFGPLIADLPNVSIRKTREHNWIEQANKEAADGAPYRRRLPCEQPFYMMMVHSDGDISMCCVDSKKELLIGNATTSESLKAIVNSPTLREWRKAHLRADFSHLSACSQCDLASSVDQPLHDHREYLIRLIDAAEPSQ